MKKQSLLLFVLAGMLSVQVQAQKSEEDPEAVRSGGVLMKRAFKTEMPAADKTETWEVKGISSVVFATSNLADGSHNSYKHSLRITIELTMSDVKAGKYQLVFYSAGENMPYAMSRLDGTTTIYYPVAIYDDIRQKLEQSLTARKKVTIKVSEKTNGFKEGVLTF
ncbi:MAG: hypothetical protein J0M10_18690 [Chitinophagales bacterium]|nr:hypothetical protein [Chitinophagales bacterium]